MISLNTPVGRAVAVFCLAGLVFEIPKAAAWCLAGLLLAYAINRVKGLRGSLGRAAGR